MKISQHAEAILRILLILSIVFLGLVLYATTKAAYAADVVGPSCALAWDYSAEDQKRIDGFSLIVNKLPWQNFPAATRTVECKNIKLDEGENSAKLVAFKGTLKSAYSNTLTFTYVAQPLSAPGKARLIIDFEAPK